MSNETNSDKNISINYIILLIPVECIDLTAILKLTLKKLFKNKV